MKVRLLSECLHCGSITGEIRIDDLHNKLICDTCKKYIKFVSKDKINSYKKIIVEKPTDEYIDSCSLCVPNQRINPSANYCSGCGNKLYKK